MSQSPIHLNSMPGREHAQSPGSVSQAHGSRWRIAVAWGLPLSLASFFLWLGFEASFIDLAIRWSCVGLVAYLGSCIFSTAASNMSFQATPQKSSPEKNLLAVHKALFNLSLPALLQQIVDETFKLIPCRGALLILLDDRQERPEHIVTSGQVPSSLGYDLTALLPTKVFLEVLELGTVCINTPHDLHHQLGSLQTREFAHQSLFIGRIRHQNHLAFLLLADRVGPNGFLDEDIQLFRTIAEIAIPAIQNARSFTELQATEKKQRELLHDLITAQEQESKLAAEEWHDRISRKLFDILQGLRSFHNLIVNKAPENSERLQQLTAEVDGVAALVRGLANELHPSALDDLGVAAAIQEYVTDIIAGGKEHEPLQVSVQTDDVERQLPNEAKLILFRITQEALRNIRKHAEAKNVQIAFVQEHSGVSLMIKDDGKGFNPDFSCPGHFGLQYMRERAEACGGTFRVVSAQGQGTEVQVKFPTLHASTHPLDSSFSS